MDRVIDKLAISYPVKLYYSAKRYLTVMTGCLLMGVLGYFIIPLAKQDEVWIVVAAGWLLILASIFGFIVCFYTWSKKKTIVIIEESDFSFFNIFKRNQKKTIVWQEVVSIDLTPWTHGNITHWMLSISIKSNNLDGIKVIKQFLKPLYLEGYLLNEKEIFYLLEQAFEGKNVLNYKCIDMKINDRLVKNFSFWFTLVVMIVTIIAICVFLIISVFL